MIYHNQWSTKADICHRLWTWFEPVWLILCSTAYKGQIPWISPSEMWFLQGVCHTLPQPSCPGGNGAAVPLCRALCTAWGLLFIHRAESSDHPEVLCEDAACWLKKLCLLLLAVLEGFPEEMGNWWTIVCHCGICICKKMLKKSKLG